MYEWCMRRSKYTDLAKRETNILSWRQGEEVVNSANVIFGGASGFFICLYVLCNTFSLPPVLIYCKSFKNIVSGWRRFEKELAKCCRSTT